LNDLGVGVEYKQFEPSVREQQLSHGVLEDVDVRLVAHRKVQLAVWLHAREDVVVQGELSKRFLESIDGRRPGEALDLDGNPDRSLPGSDEPLRAEVGVDVLLPPVQAERIVGEVPSEGGAL